MTLRYFSNGVHNVIHDDSNGGGDRYLDEGYVEYKDASEFPHKPVPHSVSRLQFKRALGSDWEKAKRVMEENDLIDDFYLSDRILRSSELVRRLSMLLGMKYTDVDDLFRKAGSMRV